jgi:DNA-binding response OmpR family regulator
MTFTGRRLDIRTRRRIIHPYCTGDGRVEAAAAPVNVLVVNPSERFLTRMRELLERSGHRVSLAGDIALAVAAVSDMPPDLIVMDRALLQSDVSGFLASLPSDRRLPVIFLTTSNASGNHELAVDPAQLERLEAMLGHLKEAVATDGRTIQVGELAIDTARKEISFRERRVKVSPIQYRLLTVLASRVGQVVGFRDLLRDVWGHDGDEDEARELLKWQVRHLRQRIGLDADRNEYIQSVRGFGYMLAKPAVDQQRLFETNP